MFTSVDTLARDLQQYSAGDDHFAMYRIRNTEVGRAVLQLASGKRPDALSFDEGDLEVLKSAAIKFVRDVMLSPTSDHYALLGVAVDADASSIREQFRRLMGLVHPDTRPTDFPADAATRVNRAYAVLAEADTRSTYTDELFGPPAATSIVKARPSMRGNESRAAEATGFGARLAGIAQVFRSRSTLLWLAVLLLVPLGVWFASLFTQDAPPRLVEARPRLQAAPSISTNPGEAAVAPASAQPAAPAAAIATPPASVALAAAAPQLPARVDKAESQSQRLPGTPERLPAGLMSNQLSERSLALTARGLGRVSSAAPGSAATPAALPTTAIVPDSLPRGSVVRDLAPTAAAATGPVATPVAVAPPTVAVAVPAAPRSDAGERSENSANRVRTADADDILVRFTNAYETGSINGFAQLLSPSMAGRRQMLNDYERVFSGTRQRSIKFNQLKHSANGDRVATSGYATVTTVDQDNRTTTQRVFLELEIGRDRGEPRIEKLANYVIH